MAAFLGQRAKKICEQSKLRKGFFHGWIKSLELLNCTE